jgi:hypothetical protein
LLIRLEQSECFLSLDLQDGAELASKNVDTGKIQKSLHASTVQDPVFNNGSLTFSEIKKFTDHGSCNSIIAHKKEI